MTAPLLYRVLADAVLLLHFAIVMFVVGGLVLVWAGNIRGWQWVNAPWFRVLHLGAIGIVIAQAWLGKVCPLTTLESWLREQAGQAPYAGAFIEHWVHGMLFYDMPSWVFALIYTAFGGLIVLAWRRFPPRRRIGRDAGTGS